MSFARIRESKLPKITLPNMLILQPLRFVQIKTPIHSITLKRHRFALRRLLAESRIAEIGKWVIWEDCCGVLRNLKFVALFGYHHFRDMQDILQELSAPFN